MKRRRGWLLAIPLVVGLGGFAFLRMSRTFAILDTRMPLQLIRAEDLGRNSLVDVTVPLFGNICYPRPADVPFTLGPDGGWNVDPRTYAGVIYRAPIPRPSFEIGYDVLTFESGETVISAVSDHYQINCPLVFGSVPRTATLQTNGFRSISWPIRLQLPPIGIPEPKLPHFSANLGDWRVKIDPAPWIAPAYPIRYQIQADDGAHSPFLINIRSPRLKPNQEVPFTWRCAPQDPAIVYVERLWPANERLDQPLTFDCVVKRLKGMRAKFRIKSRDDFIWVIGNDSRVYAQYVPGLEPLKFLGHAVGVDALALSGHWIAAGSRSENTTQEMDPNRYSLLEKLMLSPRQLAGVKNGDVINGVIFRIVEERTLKVKLNLPDPWPYREGSYPTPIK